MLAGLKNKLQSLLNWAKENKFQAFIVAVVCLAVFGWANLHILHWSSSPGFCKWACHSMVQEVDNWEASTHGKSDLGIDCVACHYREGAVNYMIHKVLAMSDLKNTFTGWAARPIDDHEHYGDPSNLEYISQLQYAEEQKMTDQLVPQYIHNPITDGGFEAKTGDWRGDAIKKILEHQPDLEKWLMKDGKPILGSYRIQMHRYGFLWRVVEENCRNCHSERGNRGRHSKYRVADKAWRRQTRSKAPHNSHLEKNIACLDCHQEVVHSDPSLKDESGVTMPRMTICFRCHNDKRAPRECTLCHSTQKDMNEGVGGVAVEDTPNYMYPDSATCVDCHLEENEYKMAPAVCVECHDDDESYADVVTEWQDAATEKLAAVEIRLKEVQSAITAAKTKGKDTDEASLLLRDAEHNYNMVLDDGSKGAHNSEYVEALLDVSAEKLETASGLL